jgi:hypothetical protein
MGAAPQPPDTISLPLTRAGRDMMVVFPLNMSRAERKKAVSELFRVIRALRQP